MIKKILMTVMVGVFGITTYLSSTSLSNGQIPIPTDLLNEYEVNMKKIVEYEDLMKPHTAVIEEIIRRTADRAGLKVSDYRQYAFKRECKCLEKVVK